jgi:hypothetical protein
MMDVYNTIAHELGHSIGLQHPFKQFSGHTKGFDPANIMDYMISAYNLPRVLRKYNEMR